MKRFLPLFGALFLFGCYKTSIDDLTSPEALHSRAVGASAHELLRSDKYASLVVEVQHMPGYAPDSEALGQLLNFLSAHLDKPGGVTIVTKEVPASGKAALEVSEVVEHEKKHRSAFSRDGRMAIYLLYTDGAYTDPGTLGVAYRNTSAAIFGKTIHDNSGGIGQPSRSKLETTVLTHEVGHLLGLVDNGTPMQQPHKDGAHGSHCNQQSCLMYYAAETTDIMGFLLQGKTPVLDDNCVADLQAVRK